MSAKPLKLVDKMKSRTAAPKEKKRTVPWVEVESPSRPNSKKRPNGEAAMPNGRAAKKRRVSIVNGVPLVVNAIQEQRRDLPIAAGQDALVQEIGQHDVTIIVGETGSGKTTQVPQYILDSGLARSGVIAITQPRRVAATSLAERVAKEQNTKLGDRVGYSIRFEERCGSQTRIKYLTDGMIVREMLSDRLLSRYSVVVVDEAHERSLRTDLLMANLKDVLAERKSGTNPLKVVVMSATLDARKFSTFFNGAKILYVQGRQHPVKIFHAAQPQEDYIQSAMRAFFQIHTERPPGDVLIFLPGQEDIEALESSIKLFANRLPKQHMNVLVCPMFAAQAHGKNAKVFQPAPPNARKCILATNIAETSITIPGVTYVVDTGKSKENRYMTAPTGNGLDTLMTRDITKSSAMQRAGRAGRDGAGFCFRLYTEDAFNKMLTSPQPEILRVNLAASMLQLKAMGFDVEKLDLMDKPDSNAIRSALITLWSIRALNNKMQLTTLGHQMSSFPLEPMHARSLLASADHGCTSEIIDILSVLSASSSLLHGGGGMDERDRISEARLKFSSLQGDHCRILNIFRAYEELQGSFKKERSEWCHSHWINERTLTEAMNIRQQLRQHCDRMKVDWKKSCSGDDVELRELKIVKALAHGLAPNSAMIQPDGTYKQCLGQTVVKIHPSSVLADKKVSAIIFEELVFTNNVYARGVSRVPKAHLQTLALAQRQSNP